MSKSWQNGEIPSWVIKGAPCVALRINDEARRHKENPILTDLIVSKVGRQYLEVSEAERPDWPIGKFHLSDGRQEISAGACRYRLFPSEQHAKDHLDSESKYQEIQGCFTSGSRKELTSQQIQQIHDILFPQGV